jgi:hypothetical protein
MPYNGQLTNSSAIHGSLTVVRGPLLKPPTAKVLTKVDGRRAIRPTPRE